MRLEIKKRLYKLVEEEDSSERNVTLFKNTDTEWLLDSSSYYDYKELVVIAKELKKLSGENKKEGDGKK